MYKAIELQFLSVTFTFDQYIEGYVPGLEPPVLILVLRRPQPLRCASACHNPLCLCSRQ